MKKLNIGHIGWLAWDDSPDYTTVAWCDANQEKMKKLEAENQHPSLSFYTDYREMLKHPDLDVVIISTPNQFHAEQAIAFLEAGKHVFLEKPMGINKKETDAIFHAAQISGKLLVMDFELRVSLFAVRLKELIDSGDYGELRRIEFVHHRGGWLNEGNGAWRVRPELSGGLYFMEPIHQVDLFRFLGGSIESVQSVASPNVLSHYQFQDNVCSHFFFESGAIGTILTSHTHSAQTDDPEKWAELGHDMQLILTLSKGSIGVNGAKHRILVNRFEEYPKDSGGMRVVLDHVEDYSDVSSEKFEHDITGMRREFLRRLVHHESPVVATLDAWKTHQVCLAAEQSLGEDFRRVAVNYELPSLQRELSNV